MIIKTRNDLIKINETDEIPVSKAISYLSRIPAEVWVSRFVSNKKFPKTYRMKVLKTVLEDEVSKIKILEENLGTELNYKLNWFSTYTQFQLIELLHKRENQINELSRIYREDMWLMLLQVAHQVEISDDKLIAWINEGMNLPERTFEKSDDFNKAIDKLFVDGKNEISGLDPEQFKEVLQKSATVVEIKNFAKMHNISIPQNISKAEVYEQVYNEALNKWPNREKEITEELKDLTIIQLQRYAKTHNLEVYISLKKETIIELIVEGYLSKPLNPILDAIPFNLPLRNKVLVDDVPKGKTPIVEEKVEVKPVIEQPHTTSNNDGEIHIHVYYDGIERPNQPFVQTRPNGYTMQFISEKDFEEPKDQEEKVESKPKKKIPRLLLLLILLVIFAVLTVLYTLIMDVTGLVPHESNPITKFIFELIFGSQ